MKITFITVSSPAVRYLAAANDEIAKLLPNALELCVYYAVAEFGESKKQSMINDIAESDTAFVDLMGSPPGVVSAVYAGLDKCGGDVVPYGNGGREYLRLANLPPRA